MTNHELVNFYFNKVKHTYGLAISGFMLGGSLSSAALLNNASLKIFAIILLLLGWAMIVYFGMNEDFRIENENSTIDLPLDDYVITYLNSLRNYFIPYFAISGLFHGTSYFNNHSDFNILLILWASFCGYIVYIQLNYINLTFQYSR